MVALDDDGNPARVPPLDPRTPAEQRRMREAELRRRNRLAERGSIIPPRPSRRHLNELGRRPQRAAGLAGSGRLAGRSAETAAGSVGPSGCRDMNPGGSSYSGRHRGPVPVGGIRVGLGEVSKRIPAIWTNAWPGLV